jgi:hypothetical protein
LLSGLDEPTRRRDLVSGKLFPLRRSEVGGDDVGDEALLVEVGDVDAAMKDEEVL